MKRTPAFIAAIGIASQIHALASPDSWNEKREIWLSSTAGGGLDIDVTMTHPIRKIQPVVQGGDRLLMEGQAQYDKGKDPYLGTKFSTTLKVMPEGGSHTGGEGVIKVRSAKAVTLLLTCATDFNKARPQEPLAGGWQKRRSTRSPRRRPSRGNKSARTRWRMFSRSCTAAMSISDKARQTCARCLTMSASPVSKEPGPTRI